MPVLAAHCPARLLRPMIHGVVVLVCKYGFGRVC
jgi:hypothetical protein